MCTQHSKPHTKSASRLDLDSWIRRNLINFCTHLNVSELGMHIFTPPWTFINKVSFTREYLQMSCSFLCDTSLTLSQKKILGDYETASLQCSLILMSKVLCCRNTTIIKLLLDWKRKNQVCLDLLLHLGLSCSTNFLCDGVLKWHTFCMVLGGVRHVSTHTDSHLVKETVSLLAFPLTTVFNCCYSIKAQSTSRKVCYGMEEGSGRCRS